MYNNIAGFYKRNKQNKLKDFLLRLSLVIIFITITSKSVNFIVNDLIFKRPKPNLAPTGNYSDIIYYIYSPYGLIASLLMILSLVMIDFINNKKKDNSI
ncbi:hypothetical protein [Alkaliphilus serpentinus]|uniref:Uncharacterized protein n=1 Tax=Alkaliphilus serpentinus TaxID=1482731 RepID=A0A833HLW5_9FIRM|nr:hypothetical protein [Alkaliphilus serpentinus]KAB3526745.1 hypothetical protein F8153_13325 [Alkaliphilus serpentinus]